MSTSQAANTRISQTGGGGSRVDPQRTQRRLDS